MLGPLPRALEPPDAQPLLERAMWSGFPDTLPWPGSEPSPLKNQVANLLDAKHCALALTEDAGPGCAKAESD